MATNMRRTVSELAQLVGGRVVGRGDGEVGANTCVDRAKFGSTTVGDGTKMDNLVQIAHNRQIGSHCVIAGLSGLSGSVTLGDWVRIAGGMGIADHVRHLDPPLTLYHGTGFILPVKPLVRSPRDAAPFQPRENELRS